MPSQTTKMPWRESKPKLSSLFVRTHPTSVLPATSSASAIFGFRVTADVRLFVTFETIILFSKRSVGEFNIAGGDSRPLTSWGIGANFTNLICALQVTVRLDGLPANVDHT